MPAPLEIVLGGVLLVLGRRLFWLVVAAVGFALGIFITPLLMPTSPEWMILIGGLILALFGLALALTLQKLAIGTAGFFAGAWVAAWLLRLFAIDPGKFQWLILIAGGIAGVILLATLFEWGLIWLSSLVGANLLLMGLRQILSISDTLAPMIFLGIFGLGVFLQARTLDLS